MALKKKLRNRQGGFIVSAELALITTILVIGLIVGMVAVRDALVAELHDIAEGIGELDQSFTFNGINNSDGASQTEGTVFIDEVDDAGVGAGTFGDAGMGGDNIALNYPAPGATEDLRSGIAP